MYKKAARLKLRFTTKLGGNISVEQLWDLKPSQLAEAIKHQHEILKKSEPVDGLDFLEKDEETDNIEQLRFDILKDIYQTKKHESEDAREDAEKREKNKRILELIAKKQDEELAGKSIEELKAMLKD